MKARHEFPSDIQYRDYLRDYYSGLFMQKLLEKKQTYIELWGDNYINVMAEDSINFANSLTSIVYGK